jgi:SAM-dependent methyltransferase
MGRELQVEPSTHYARRYLTLPRMVTHWHQANEVARVTAAQGSVLEIGPGSGHTTWVMRQWGLQVTTLDFDPKLRPDAVGDVTRLPFADKSFDSTIAAEVLEHIPFADFATALRELKRVSRSYVIVTLPAPFVGVSALINWPLLEPRGLFLGLPYWRKHAFNGEHHWELGKRGYELRRITDVITRSGLAIERRFRPAPSLYCYFFVCRV